LSFEQELQAGAVPTGQQGTTVSRRKPIAVSGRDHSGRLQVARRSLDGRRHFRGGRRPSHSAHECVAYEISISIVRTQHL